MNINQRVYEIMRNLLGSVSTGVNVDDDLILDEIPNIDSLFFLEMVSSFEKEFNIKFDLEDLVALGKAEVKTLDDLADLAGDELSEIVGEHKMSLSAANEIIMEARQHWFEDEEEAEEEK